MRRARKWCARAGSLIVAAGLAAGCGTGAPASTSAWQGSADRTLGQALSGLGTARVALRLEAQDRAPHDFTVVTVTDAIDTTGKEVSGFQVAQPPDGLHRANAAVNQALDDAMSLLVDVRIALASPGVDGAGAGQLIDRVDALRKKLDDLDQQVQSSPASVGSP
ncbi:hypothetical protein [Nocardioides pocheonensis]|jgi:hypothetical protein|uniref:Lipoprotein n=1 Tax=Nocardioides pocheonensis TaxID=661485 RepID=A0A3N0GG29_9ACTN|nr:hypothetical protein [Nocardioides pocheonensis]RNM11122.1 hypothetical protein EFL26_23555 [Nocardioides pocheonensis]